MKALLIPCLLTCASASIAAQSNPYLLWYRAPAENWETQALPIGNGRIGCMAYGSVPGERIQFNEISLWTGDELNTGCYQNFGDLYLDFQHPAQTEYRRELDTRRAVERVTYTSGGVNYTREYFASAPAQVIVMRFTAGKRGCYSGTIRVADAHDAKPTSEGRRITCAGALDNGLKYESQVLVVNEGGSVAAEDGQLKVTGADSLTVFLAARTNYLPDYKLNWRGPDPHAQVTKDVDSAAGKAFDDLLSAHVKDYQRFFNRFALSVGNTDRDAAALPTDERLAAYTNGGIDPELEQLFCQYGRYLLISSSRPGSLPANLQGLWNESNTPPWTCDYHANINVEMNYWLAEPTNLSELHMPFLNYVDSLREVRHKLTQTELGPVRGWAVYTENNIFGRSRWENITGNAWYCQHFWEHYAFTGDKAYLRKIAYPILKEICEFWEDKLKKLPDGTLVVADGFSPEHGPREDGVTIDQMIVWDLFTNYIQASEVLGVDADYRRKVSDMRSKLLAPKVGKWGQLQEWMTDRDDPTDQHRHVSHMFGLHPGRQISPVTTPELAKAARVSLDARGDGGTGWSKAWKISFWARLLDGNRAYKLLRSQLTLVDNTKMDYVNAGGTYANLLDAHPPFQIDGNFGATAAIAEMLLQSQTGEVQILPALPDAWADGYVTGLCARGGFVVDMSWKKGKLVNVVIHSKLGNTCRLRYGHKTTSLRTVKGGGYRLDTSLSPTKKQ